MARREEESPAPRLTPTESSVARDPRVRPIEAARAPTESSASRSRTSSGRRLSVRRLRSGFSMWRASIRRSDVVVAAIVGALFTVWALTLYARAEAEARLNFAQRAQRLEAAVTEKLSRPREDLAALARFLSVSERVTARRFALLTDPILLQHHFLHAFEWLPVVRDPERPLYEQEHREAGIAGYVFWDVGADGKRREAGRRELYLPIHYMEPPRASALGFDVAADATRRPTAEKARDTGEIAASPPILLTEESERASASPAVAAYAPIYPGGDPGAQGARRASLSGFAVAIFRVEPLVAVAAGSIDATGLGLAVRDPEASSLPLAERPPGFWKLERRRDLVTEFPVQFADRRWALEVAALPGAFLPSVRSAATAAIAGWLAALVGFVLLTMVRTMARLRRQIEKVGPYRLVARLGEGAMGVVWEARHALLRRPTAVKLLAPGTEGERSLARFEREVQMTAGLTHPSTIAIYDYGRTPDGVFYYAMELIRGINLLQLVSFDGPLPPGRVVHLLRQACGPLSEAHAAGLIHRDIKPANLMLCVYGGIPDFLKVLDFGLVKDIGATEVLPGGPVEAMEHVELSQDGSLLGTPLYMAPEGMSDPTRVDGRADLFALGAVGYFLLTGESPFPGRTALEVFALEKQGPPSPLSAAAARPVPPDLDAIIARCLSFRREDRPESAEALDGMLAACRVDPPWTLEDAREWWRVRGSGALAAATAQRVERPGTLGLSSSSSDPSA